MLASAGVQGFAQQTWISAWYLAMGGTGLGVQLCPRHGLLGGQPHGKAQLGANQPQCPPQHPYICHPTVRLWLWFTGRGQ